MSSAIVGEVVGPVSVVASGEGSARATDTGQGFDFAIGGLLFNVASDDDNPYQRATAQFRKDQLDTSPTPGDQSLVGYWTRGQLSFHHGAGVTYYEVEEGDEVLNRFNTGDGIDPFTPGQVTLAKSFAPDGGVFTDVKWAGEGLDFFAILDGGSLRYSTASTWTAYATTDASAVSAATTGPLCAYVGTGGKKIERVHINTNGPASGALYTHTNAIVGLWYVKDRLLMVDDANTFYQLAPNPTGALPVAISASDKVFTAGDPLADWCVTDTPGPILIGNGQNVYAVVPDATSGAIPTLSGPIVVGQLPVGETLSALHAYLGYVVLGTSSGVRVGVLSDSGSLTYGPLLFDRAMTTGPAQLAARGSSVFAPVVTPGGDGGVYQIDLSQQIGNGLEFAYCRLGNPVPGLSGTYGCALRDGDLIVFGGTNLYQEGADLTSGTLTTGYHRFATLEPKQFRSVRVRVGGSGGTVAVSRVMADGSAVSLYTMDVSQTADETITLGLSAPQERVALRFTLTPDALDATKGPSLLGYQLYALPAPTRQRMVQIPLMCYDVENRPPARRTGHRGAAWERLSALEDMERSGGTFRFQDFRTGEAGECFIESVDFQGKTPPSASSTGFGGLVTLTIRKL